MRDPRREIARMVPDLRRQDGVIIIAVLWICAMIMWFALQIAAETRLKGEEQVHLFRRSQALHLAIGGSYEALAQMAQANSAGLDDMSGRFSAPSLRHKGDKASPDDPWQPDGEPHLVDYQTGQALIIIEAEGRKVNVNKTNNAQLKLVMEKAGLEEDEAERLTDVFLDFIDKDDLTRLNGAEKEQYQSLGLPYGPFNGPLTSLDQMLLIPGITQQLYYGYGMKSEEEAAKEEESEVPDIPALPAKYSLFRMLTVYGKNVNFQDDSKTDPFDDDNEREQIRWEKGGIYRIFSCGRTFNGPPTVILWMVIRYNPETPKGYEVLYRKIL